MCGILGVIAPSGHFLSERDADCLAMRDVMTARGPDDAGFYRRENVVLAHRRLAIRDLSAGQQPWISPDGNIGLVYNGELYNDQILRRELMQRGHVFQTQCDTEVVLAAFLEWGRDCLSRLRGMFAFGIYDFARRRLFLARDRFGIKPLFLMNVGKTLVFASSVAALLRHPSANKTPNWPAISHYLTTLRLTLGRQTLFSGIWQLQPGECLEWQNDEVQIQQYWDYPTKEEDLSFNETAVALREGLANAVQVRMASDVPVGMFLSGGVDSNTIACFLRETVGNRPIVGTCGGGEITSHEDSKGLDDFTAAKQLAGHVRFQYHETRVSPGEYFDTWQHLVRQNHLPLATPSDVILHQLARKIKPHAGVVLGGEGADELLCGYEIAHWAGRDFEAANQLGSSAFPRTAQSRLIQASLQQQYGRAEFSSLVDHYFALNSLIPLSVKPALFQPEIFEKTQGDALMVRHYAGLLSQREEDSASQRYLRLLHRVNLESLLSRLDSATMQAGLEARVPFTDHVLVEKMFRVPFEQKLDVAPSETAPYLASGDLAQRGSLRSKKPLRQIASELMPATLAFRPKASFPTPVAQWITGPWQETLQTKFAESPFGREVFNPNVLTELADNLPQTGMWAWPILNLLEWGDQQFAA